MMLLLRLDYATVLTMPSLRSHCVMIWPCPHYIFYHVQSLTTSFMSMKTLLRSNWFLIHSTNSYRPHLIFPGHSKNVAECEEGITRFMHVCSRVSLRLCHVQGYE